MSEEGKKGLLRVGADFFGGPVDTTVMALQGMPRNLLPPTPIAQLIARAMGLPTGTVLPQGKENPSIIGSSEWIADKTGITGDSPEYRAARLAGNLGLMATPAAVNAIRNFKPRPGDLNMWIGPKAKGYDAEQAGYLNEVYERFLRRREKPDRPRFLEDVDDFNALAMSKHKAIVEPASGKVLQFKPDTVKGVNPQEFARLEQRAGDTFVTALYGDSNLERYPGLKSTIVERSDDPKMIGSFSQDPTVKSPTAPFREGTMALNTDGVKAHKPLLQSPHRFAADVIRHEIGHSIQASEGLPRGGNAELVKQVATNADNERALLLEQRSLGHEPPPSPKDMIIEKALGSGIQRGLRDPEAAYRALVGERLSTSAESHSKPWSEVLQYGIPKFSGSLVMDKGQLIPTQLYLRGLLPPYGSTPPGVMPPGSVEAAQGLLSPTVPPFRKPPRP